MASSTKENSKRRITQAVLVPENLKWWNGYNDYSWEEKDGREFFITGVEKGDLYPGQILILKPTKKRLNLENGKSDPTTSTKYWEVVKDE